ncbi:MAG: putative small multi-drug export protein [Firmicutes bacterium ADurb.Bin419]|nr:MAG: putative small multi-drug export protein [Firmicutes bacterium ADurb.Bin419]
MFKKYLIILFVSMIPLIELRGAIPIGLSTAFGNSLPLLPLYIVAILGNMLPVPIIYLFARRVLVWGSNKKYTKKFFSWCLKKGEKAGKSLEKKAGKGLYWALFLFVGIPLPGTGAWTGTLAASLLDMDFKKSTIAIMAGVVLAGIIMGLASAGVFGAIGTFTK